MSPYAHLSPAMQQLIAISAQYPSADNNMAAQRAAYDALCRYFTPPRSASLAVHDWTLPNALALRCYQPVAAPPDDGWPVVLYLHGGGWVVGNVDSHEFICVALAEDLQVAVVAVDYRLAPEHPFPAALEDCLAAYQYLLAQGTSLALNTQQLVVAGDSAGGNLAAALCLQLRDQGEPLPKVQVLIYPALASPDMALPAHQEHAHAPLLTHENMLMYLQYYAPQQQASQDTRLFPLCAASLAGLPPAWVMAAECDPLRDDGKVYVERLQVAGVAAEYHLGRGLLHGCLRAMGFCVETQRLYQQMVRFMAGVLRQ